MHEYKIIGLYLEISVWFGVRQLWKRLSLRAEAFLYTLDPEVCPGCPSVPHFVSSWADEVFHYNV